MKIYQNGKYRNATAEEISAMSVPDNELPVEEITDSERLAAVESLILHMIIGGENNG